MKTLLPVDQIIENFGGIRPLAKRLGVPVTTVQGWKKRRTIPQNRLKDIQAAARQDNVVIYPDADQNTDMTETTQKTKTRDIKINIVNKTVLSIAIIFMIIVLITGFFLAPELYKARQNSARVAELEQQLRDIQQELSAKPPSFSDRVVQTVETATVLKDKITDLEQKLSQQDNLVTTITDMKNLVLDLKTAVQAEETDDEDLEAVLDDISTEDLKAAAMLLGLTQLRKSLERDTTFTSDLEILKRLADDDPELAIALEQLAPYAENGVMDEDALKAEFQSLAGDIIIAELDGTDLSWREAAKKRLQNYVRIRKQGAAQSHETDAVVARAQDLLDQGDIDGAMAELRTLQGPAAQTAAPWLRQAEGAQAAENVVALVTARVRDRLSHTSVPTLEALIDFLDQQNIVPQPPATLIMPTPNGYYPPQPDSVSPSLPPPPKLAPVESF